MTATRRAPRDPSKRRPRPSSRPPGVSPQDMRYIPTFGTRLTREQLAALDAIMARMEHATRSAAMRWLIEEHQRLRQYLHGPDRRTPANKRPPRRVGRDPRTGATLSPTLRVKTTSAQIAALDAIVAELDLRSRSAAARWLIEEHQRLCVYLQSREEEKT